MAKQNLDLSVVLDILSKFIHRWEVLVFSLEQKGTLKDLCVTLANLSKQYEQIDELRKKLGALYDRMNEGIVPQAFENAGLDKVSVPELGRSFYPLLKFSASIVNKPAALRWLKDNGLEGIVEETVNRNTLAATLKGRLLEEGLDPPESMKLDKYTIIGSSKYTPKEK